MELTPGSSTPTMGRVLEKAGVIQNRYAFDLLRLFKHGTLRAGEYRFDHPAPAIEVYARIARGDIYTRALTIPEGENIFDIATRVEENGFGSRQDFLNAVVNHVNLISISIRGPGASRAISSLTRIGLHAKQSLSRLSVQW